MFSQEGCSMELEVRGGEERRGEEINRDLMIEHNSENLRLGAAFHEVGA